MTNVRLTTANLADVLAKTRRQNQLRAVMRAPTLMAGNAAWRAYRNRLEALPPGFKVHLFDRETAAGDLALHQLVAVLSVRAHYPDARIVIHSAREITGRRAAGLSGQATMVALPRGGGFGPAVLAERELRLLLARLVALDGTGGLSLGLDSFTLAARPAPPPGECALTFEPLVPGHGGGVFAQLLWSGGGAAFIRRWIKAFKSFGEEPFTSWQTMARFRHAERPRTGLLIDRGGDIISYCLFLVALGLSPYCSLVVALVVLVVVLINSIYVLLCGLTEKRMDIGRGGIGATEGRLMLVAWVFLMEFAGGRAPVSKLSSIAVFEYIAIGALAAMLFGYAISLAARISKWALVEGVGLGNEAQATAADQEPSDDQQAQGAVIFFPPGRAEERHFHYHPYKTSRHVAGRVER